MSKDAILIGVLKDICKTYGYCVSVHDVSTDVLELIVTAWDADAVGGVELCRLIKTCTSWQYFEAVRIATLGRLEAKYVVRSANMRLIKLYVFPGCKSYVPKSERNVRDVGLALWY